MFPYPVASILFQGVKQRTLNYNHDFSDEMSPYSDTSFIIQAVEQFTLNYKPWFLRRNVFFYPYASYILAKSSIRPLAFSRLSLTPETI